MWLNELQVNDAALRAYRKALRLSSPNHVVIDNLFDNSQLDAVISVLQQQHNWTTQKHSYSALYVDNAKWQKTPQTQRFVKRDLWQRAASKTGPATSTIADDFLTFLRGDEFMALLSRIFKVSLTDINVAKPDINTNYFRLAATDFVNQHADDSPGREVCMLLYLNKHWHHDNGGELVFRGTADTPVTIAPLHNRCVLFNPASPGAEHWVKALTTKNTPHYRYNVTSWYWSE
ncbi:2OG-Fe(II) oxygenase [Rheinheimera baltica]|uniref:2OG-Fe(II) oxygenase n=1 Tax=Rheinheimera baltica TaxID=67576 RepID=UPI00273D1949|nr:2OG-Fe(II) oxygenase [Rheinheimera baltica]MDP5190992.1 2OG-Fe(II) oxygenase [Rheinheimera baltica]